MVARRDFTEPADPSVKWLAYRVHPVIANCFPDTVFDRTIVNDNIA